jgi:hypothetical protein
MPTRRKPRKPLAGDSSPRERSLYVLSLQRHGYSLRRAADLARTDPRTVLRHAGVALKKQGGRWAARPFDRIPREMTVLTPAGPVEVTVRDSRTASLLAEQANAVRAYRDSGDEGPLRRLRRRRVQIRGQPVDLETDPVRLDRLAAGGELHYELYRH